jgi:hypothetical protein
MQDFLECNSYDADRYKFNKIERIAQGLFSASEHTSMYNYTEDIPDYMKVFLLSLQVDRAELLDAGFKDITFKIDHDY